MSYEAREAGKTKTGIIYLGLLIQGLQLEGFRTLMKEAETMSPFLDPTWYMQNADHLDDFLDLLDPLIQFQKASQKWIEKFGKKGELKVTAKKSDELKLWLNLEFITNAPEEMKEFFTLELGEEEDEK